MFELSVALKYLIPRWRQLSVSIISLVSILVIALVVWLIVVFFSVKEGLEKSWIDKLIALTAPVRLTPTDKYYQSYYYLVDGISAESNYTLKTIQEKLLSPSSDPYDPEIDQETPTEWAKPDLNQDGSLKDIIKSTYQIIQTAPGMPELKAHPYEMAFATLVLKAMLKGKESYFEHATFLGSYDPENPLMAKTLLTPLVKPLARDQILVPKNFRDAGIKKGDQGYLAYYSPTASSVQEMRIPVRVEGFYDPGIMPLGGKFILANSEIVSSIHASVPSDDNLLSNGINIHFAQLSDAQRIKQTLLTEFQKNGLSDYWKVETFEEFDFAKDLIQQLRSEKNLFSLISAVIIIVACSNIISMLIILVNDKKLEIGILRSMGASSASIALIFGICGMIMGTVGSVIGVLTALATLNHLELLVNFISRMQGYDLFNPVFYGEILPNQVSFEALFGVVIATAVISLLAGIVPAIKASLIRPSIILRSE